MRTLATRLAQLEAVAAQHVAPPRLIWVIVGAKDGKPDGEPRQYLEQHPDGSLIEIPRGDDPCAC